MGMVRRCGTQQWMVKIGEYLKCSKIDDGKVRGLGAHPMQCIFFSCRWGVLKLGGGLRFRVLGHGVDLGRRKESGFESECLAFTASMRILSINCLDSMNFRDAPVKSFQKK